MTSWQYAAASCTGGACDNQDDTALAAVMPKNGPVSLCGNAARANRTDTDVRPNTFLPQRAARKHLAKWLMTFRVPMPEASAKAVQHERDRRSDQETTCLKQEYNDCNPKCVLSLTQTFGVLEKTTIDEAA